MFSTRQRFLVEEVPVKWMDRPSTTEMEGGRASEMDRLTKCPKNENAMEMNKIYLHIIVPVLKNVN